MEFLTKLVETEGTHRLREVQRETGNDVGLGYREFERINVGPSDIGLSIQASYAHYCEPRKTVEIEDYVAMELAIMKRNRYLNIFDISDDPVIVTKLRKHFDGVVYSFVPVELIEELYQTVKRGDIQ